MREAGTREGRGREEGLEDEGKRGECGGKIGQGSGKMEKDTGLRLMVKNGWFGGRLTLLLCGRKARAQRLILDGLTGCDRLLSGAQETNKNGM